jgi:hypothetical protein
MRTNRPQSSNNLLKEAIARRENKISHNE